MDFYYSDPHFFHNNIRKFQDERGVFNDLKSMHEFMIEQYNSVVNDDDVVVWVGDSFFCGTKTAQVLFNKLNGKKILVIGNHDNKPTKMMNIGFVYACSHMHTFIGGYKVNINHFPYKETMHPENKYYNRALSYKGEWLIHGHTHSSEKYNKDFRMINVCVEANEFKPVSREIIEGFIQKTESKLKKEAKT
jgi:calcineurin-like phosphoesterase family protein